MSNVSDYEEIRRELKVQGWVVEKTSNGHYQAKPPDKAKPIVTFAVSKESHAFRNTVADLRRSGFLWPPPARERGPVYPGEHENGGALNSEQRADIERRSTETETPKPKTLDELFATLKEARETLAIARVLMEARDGDLENARKALEAAKEERNAAIGRFRDAQEAFAKELDRT